MSPKLQAAPQLSQRCSALFQLNPVDTTSGFWWPFTSSCQSLRTVTVRAGCKAQHFHKGLWLQEPDLEDIAAQSGCGGSAELSSSCVLSPALIKKLPPHKSCFVLTLEGYWDCISRTVEAQTSLCFLSALKHQFAIQSLGRTLSFYITTPD